MSRKMVYYIVLTFTIAFLTELDHLNYSLKALEASFVSIFLKATAPCLMVVKALLDKNETPEITSRTELIQVKEPDGKITTTETYQEVKR